MNNGLFTECFWNYKYTRRIRPTIAVISFLGNFPSNYLHLAFFNLELAVTVIISFAVRMCGAVHVAQIFLALEFEVRAEIIAVLEPQLVAVLPVITLHSSATAVRTAIALPADQVHAVTHCVVVGHFVANVQSSHRH